MAAIVRSDVCLMIIAEFPTTEGEIFPFQGTLMVKSHKKLML